MERLTTRIAGVAAMAYEHEERHTAEEWIDMLQTCLAAYEDTGLTPEDIKQMLEDVSESYHKLMLLYDQEADRASTCRDALNTWGAEAQTLMVFEEMSELQKELCKHARGRDNQEEIAEEIADVRIMLIQMCILHDCVELADEIMIEKLVRLADRVKKARGEADD